jgi:hypothetical protein
LRTTAVAVMRQSHGSGKAMASKTSMAMSVSAAVCGPEGCPAADRTPATSVDTGGPWGSHRGHGDCAARPDPVRDRCFRRPQPCWFRHGGRTRSHAGARRARCSAVPWPACPPWCPPQPATVSGCGHPDGCSGVRCPRCWRNRGRCPDGAVHRGRCRSLRVSAATGSGRLTGVRWSGAATAARPAGAVGRAARGAARAHRSWPAAPGQGLLGGQPTVVSALDVAAPPGGDDRTSGCLRVQAEPGPGAGGQARSSTVMSGTNTSS